MTIKIELNSIWFGREYPFLAGKNSAPINVFSSKEIFSQRFANFSLVVDNWFVDLSDSILTKIELNPICFGWESPFLEMASSLKLESCVISTSTWRRFHPNRSSTLWQDQPHPKLLWILVTGNFWWVVYHRSYWRASDRQFRKPIEPHRFSMKLWSCPE